MLKLKISLVILILGFLAASFALPVLAQEASDIGDVIKNLDNVAGNAQIATIGAGGGETVYQIYARFINLFLGFVGSIFLLITVYAGFTWMMAKGNEQEVEKATKLLENSAIGIFIIMAAYLLINYVVFNLIDLFTKTNT